MTPDRPSTYRAMWPITDTGLAFPQLVAEAKPKLPRLLKLGHIRLTGPPRWWMQAARDTPGSGGITEWVLIMEAPAIRDRPAVEHYDPAAPAPQPLSRTVQLARLIDYGANLEEAIRELDCTPDALEAWCRRHDLTDLWARLNRRRSRSPEPQRPPNGAAA